MKQLVIFYTIFFSFSFISFSQPSYDWSVAQDQISGSYFLNGIHIHDIEADPSGNVYITGVFRGQVDFNVSGPGGDITSVGGTPSEDPYIAKYDASGNFQWVQRIDNPTNGGTSNDAGTSLAVDASGNVYVAGSMYNGGLGIFVARYTSTGTQSWLHVAEGYSTSATEDMLDLDPTGTYLYLFNRFNGTADLDPGPGVDNRTAVADYDFYLAKLNVSTGSSVWINTMGGTGYAEPYCVIADAGYVYITGGFPNTFDMDPSAGIRNVTSVGQTDIIMAKYGASTGSHDYSYSFGSSEHERGYNLAQDGSYIYLGTQMNGTIDFQPNAGTLNITDRPSTGTPSTAIVKYAKIGPSAQWGDTIPGSTGSYIPIVVSGGNVIMAPRYNGSGVDYDPGAGSQTRIITYASGTAPHMYLEWDGNMIFQAAEWLAKYASNTNYYPNLASDNNSGLFFGIQMTTSAQLDYSSPSTTHHTEGTYGDDAFLAHYITCQSGTNTTSTADICETSTKALTSTSIGGSWNIITGGGSILGTTYTPANITVNTLVTIRYTDDCGNTSDRSFTVFADPGTANNMTSTANMCETSTRALVGSPSGGTWSIITGGGSIAGSTYTPANIASNTTVTVRYTIAANGPCPGSTSDRTFTVYYDPGPANNTTSTANICETSTKTLVASPSGGIWSIISGGGSVAGNTYTPPNVSTNTSITVRYTILPNGSCFGSVSDQTFTVEPSNLPSITSSGGDLCNGNSRALTASISGGTWSITGGTGSGTIVGSTLTATGAGTINLRYRITNSCGNLDATQIITVVDVLSPSITSSNANICNGNSRALTATPSGGTWTVLSGPGNIIGDTLTGTGTGTIQIQYSVTNACGTYTTTQNITGVDVLSPTIISSNADMCVSDTRSLAGTPSGGTWSIIAGGSFANITAGNQLNATATGSVTIQYSVTNACGTYTTTQNINIVTTVTPSITSSISDMCDGDKRYLTASPSGGNWSILSGPGTIGAGDTLTATGAGTIQIRYSVTSGCGTGADTANILVNPIPTPNITSSNASLCVGDSRSLTGTPVGGVWSVVSGPGIIIGSTLTANAVGTILIGYTVTQSGCVGTTTQSISTIDSSNATWTSPGNVCENASTIDLNTFITGNTGGSWSGTGVTVGGLFTPTGLSGTIAITYMVGAAPCADTITHNITVNPAADASWSIPTTICESQMFNLDTLLLPAATPGGIWSGPGVTGSIFDPYGLTAPITIKYLVGTLGCADSLSITISTIAPSPATPILNLTVDTICAGDTTSIIASGSGSPVVYNVWTSLVGGTFLGQTPLTVNPSVTTTYYVEAIAPNLCPNIGGRQSITVEVNPLPIADAGTDENICFGDSVTLTASGGGTYLWNNSINSANNQVYPSSTTQYIVTVTSPEGCIDQDTVFVNVQTTGSANAVADFHVLVTGTLESIDIYSNDAGAVGTISIIGGPYHGTANVATNGMIDYISTLGYVGMDSLYYRICDPSCVQLCDTTLLLIEVQNDLTIPSGVSPNNDGRNDVFNILGLQKYPENELFIYNRWGDLVFEAKPYTNDWAGESNGAILGGEVIEGTYFYILKLGPELPMHKGYIEFKSK